MRFETVAVTTLYFLVLKILTIKNTQLAIIISHHKAYYTIFEWHKWLTELCYKKCSRN